MSDKQMLKQILQNQGAMMLAIEMIISAQLKPNLIREMNIDSLKKAIDNTTAIYNSEAKEAEGSE